MCCRRIIVLKFGGSVLASESDVRRAVHEIYRWRREGWQVLAVVSALQGRTDALAARCDDVLPSADRHARAAWLARGESEAAALLGLYLDRAGVPSRVLDPATIRLFAEGDPLDAAPKSVRTPLLLDALERDGVAVVPGFTGVDASGRTVTLGRGGSDLTALFLAHHLAAARCRLIKDVDGLYTDDPACNPTAARYRSATWDDALETDGSIVQHKAVRLARRLGFPFEIATRNASAVTTVGAPRTQTEPRAPQRRRWRVALLGHGTVGRGVEELLRQHDAEIELIGVAVRDVAGRASDARLRPLLTDDAVGLAGAGNADIVVEAIGGCDVASDAVHAALDAGAHVVTANKALIARHGPVLQYLARERGVDLRFGAAVGGALPLLEWLAAARPDARPRSIRAVLNGTVNYVLSRVVDGDGLDGAISAARSAGFAESDVSRDLSGLDVIDKLTVLSLASGDARRGRSWAREPLTPEALADAGTAPVRQVATLDLTTTPTRGAVRLETVAADDPLATLVDEHNAAEIEWSDGRTDLIRGRGAGRWPTAESVVADVLGIIRAQRREARDRSTTATAVAPSPS